MWLTGKDVALGPCVNRGTGCVAAERGPKLLVGGLVSRGVDWGSFVKGLE